jgi:hypothetical protein
MPGSAAKACPIPGMLFTATRYGSIRLAKICLQPLRLQWECWIILGAGVIINSAGCGSPVPISAAGAPR